tara:strand:+ start:98 stop:697 length:600 start_codon:yes stop_codon:yes gene_type:complete
LEYLLGILGTFGFYALLSYLSSRNKGFKEGYGIFVAVSGLAVSIFSWSLLADYITALKWYENLFWLFQIPILLLSLFSIPLLFTIIFIVFFYFPEQLFLVLKVKPKLVKFLSIFFAVIVGLVAIWWYFPNTDEICYRYLDGRYSYKTAEKKWLGTGERYGSEFGLVDNCRRYIPYVDPDKLILNKEGFWDSFYNEHIQN